MNKNIDEDVLKDIANLIECYNKNCNTYLLEYRKEKLEKINRVYKIYNLYKVNKITKQQYRTLLALADNEFYKSKNIHKFLQCQLDNCYDLVKKYIDRIVKKLNYKTNSKEYNLKEFINIMKSNDKSQHETYLVYLDNKK